MKRRFLTIAGPVLGLVILITIAPVGPGCSGFELTWTPVEDTATLYSLARPDFADQPSAFDFYNRALVVVERPQPGDPLIFDVVLSQEDGELVLLPAGVFETFTIHPGIAIDSSGTPFDELAKAPRDGYVTDAPVPVRTDVVYAVKTRQISGCNRYGKFEILDADPQGVITFRQVRNNLCNDRELIPPDN